MVTTLFVSFFPLFLHLFLSFRFLLVSSTGNILHLASATSRNNTSISQLPTRADLPSVPFILFLRFLPSREKKSTTESAIFLFPSPCVIHPPYRRSETFSSDFSKQILRVDCSNSIRSRSLFFLLIGEILFCYVHRRFERNFPSIGSFLNVLVQAENV